MADDYVMIESEVLPNGTHVASVKGREALGEVYRFEIGLLIPDPSFDLDAAVRGRATLQFNTGADPYAVSYTHLTLPTIYSV